MQRNKKSFKGQNIYVGIDVHLKTWHVTTLTESGCKFSFDQHSEAKKLFDRLNKKFPDGHFRSAYEAGFCGFSAHYALTEQGFENIVVNAADIPTTGKEKAMKTDAVDSEKIAWALKRGELTGIYIKDKLFMDDTNLMRLRQRFIKDLSRQKNRLSDETTGIIDMGVNSKYQQSVTSDALHESWFILDGRKQNSKPTANGVYINNGRKVVIK